MRRIIFGLTLSLTTLCTQGQNIKVGLKGGYNRVSIHQVTQVNILRDLEPLRPANSFHFGLTTSIALSDALGLHFEPSLVRKGSQRGENEREALSYLEVPVLLSVNPWKRLHIEAGPAAGFLLDAIVTNGVDTRRKIVSNKREISLVVGSSWDFESRLNCGARYVRSLTPVSEVQFTNESGFITDEFEEFNQYVELFVRVYILNK